VGWSSGSVVGCAIACGVITCAMAALDIRTVFDKLKEQGWGIERTNNGHWKALPPDRTRTIVYFSRTDEPRAIRNTIADLRRSGFVWADEPRTKRTSMVVEAVPRSRQNVLTTDHQHHGATPETFAEALRRLREADGLDRGAVAGLLDVTQQAVEHWEYGNNAPIREHYVKLLDLFPELRLAPEPDTKDIPKPPGRHTDLPDANQEFFAGLYDEPEPSETTMTMMPMPQPEATTRTNSKLLIVRFVRLALRVDRGENAEALSLLHEARDAGMTLDDVLEILDASERSDASGG
jgi:transcriptional regulator with XRE-family HTH domain